MHVPQQITTKWIKTYLKCACLRKKYKWGNLVAGGSCARLCHRSNDADRIIVGGGCHCQRSTLFRRCRRYGIIATGSGQRFRRHRATIVIVSVAIAVAIFIGIVVVRLVAAVVIKFIAVRAVSLFIFVVLLVHFTIFGRYFGRWWRNRLAGQRFVDFIIEFLDDVKFGQWLRAIFNVCSVSWNRIVGN